MRRLELSAGTIEYDDVGTGPAILFLHGLMMDKTLWEHVMASLSADHRCIAPTLPFGAHKDPMFPGAELSLPSLANLVSEVIDRLGLHEVTVVGNDTGGALVQILMANNPERMRSAVLVSCDAFDNFPPGLTGRTLFLTAKLPPALFGLLMQPMRLRAFRRLPIAFGWLTKRGDAATARWVQPVLQRPAIRHETVRLLRSLASDPHQLLRAADSLSRFRGPALVVWAKGDRVMPPDHGRRLAEALAAGRRVEVEDSYTLIPLDQPAELAQHIREFTRTSRTSMTR